jgi:GH15 family glucan-1,4-alpha-glucosidase
MVAAATFGLPEEIGGVRNWDYRYTWIHDAAFTVYAFLRLGHTEEANAFMRWLSDRETECGPDGSLRLMYGVDGHEELVELSCCTYAVIRLHRRFGSAMPPLNNCSSIFTAN